MRLTLKSLASQDHLRLPSSFALVAGVLSWILCGLPYHRWVLGGLGFAVVYECFSMTGLGASWCRALWAFGCVCLALYVFDELVPYAPPISHYVLLYAFIKGHFLFLVGACFAGWFFYHHHHTPHPFPTQRRVGYGFPAFLAALYSLLGVLACMRLLDSSSSSVQERLALVGPLWLAVILTDVGAYIGGRSLGGPKLAPWISPRKTWSGAGVGIVCATVGVGSLSVVWGDLPWFYVPMVSLVSQVGDGLESMLKRYYGVKDSGHLIPGHGGIFDRLDGFIGVFYALALGLLF